MSTYQPKVYKDQGGNRLVVASGGSIVVESGGAITLPSGGSALSGVAAGYKLARGTTALDGSNPTPITTGLTTIVSFVAQLVQSTSPGLGTAVLTHTSSGGAVSVYAWKPTSASDPTLIASTGTETIEWIAVGT